MGCWIKTCPLQLLVVIYTHRQRMENLRLYLSPLTVFDPLTPLHFSYYLFMSTLANESLLETFFEEAVEEIGVKNDSPFYAASCKIAEEIAMDKFLSNNP